MPLPHRRRTIHPSETKPARCLRHTVAAFGNPTPPSLLMRSRFAPLNVARDTWGPFAPPLDSFFCNWKMCGTECEWQRLDTLTHGSYSSLKFAKSFGTLGTKFLYLKNLHGAAIFEARFHRFFDASSLFFTIKVVSHFQAQTEKSLKNKKADNISRECQTHIWLEPKFKVRVAHRLIEASFQG